MHVLVPLCYRGGTISCGGRLQNLTAWGHSGGYFCICCQTAAGWTDSGGCLWVSFGLSADTSPYRCLVDVLGSSLESRIVLDQALGTGIEPSYVSLEVDPFLCFSPLGWKCLKTCCSVMLIPRSLKLFTCSTSPPLMQTGNKLRFWLDDGTIEGKLNAHFENKRPSLIMYWSSVGSWEATK